MDPLEPVSPEETAHAIDARERIRHLYMRNYCPKCGYPHCVCEELKQQEEPVNGDN